MTRGEAKMLETETALFPLNFTADDKDFVSVEETADNPANQKQPVKTDLESRFARLKKSLRKRSVSIL